MTIDQFTKSSLPVTILVNIANPVAVKLAKILLEQGSRLLIVDKLTQPKRQLLGEMLNRQDCLFMEAESTFKNLEKFKKIDYVYYFLSQLTVGSTYPVIFPENMEIERLGHKEFIRESNRLDAYMKLAVSFDSSFTLITSGYVSQLLEPLPEPNVQLQKYAESLVLEYAERNNANARVVRLGELIGRDSDLSSPTYVARLLREVILRRKVNVFGDGMQQNYLVNTEDAVYAVLKAAFSPEAKGRTYLAAYSHPFTSLSVAYQLLELTAEEREVVFNEILPKHELVTKLKDMCLAQSVSGLGWDPQVQLEQALSEAMASMAKQLDKPWKQQGAVATAVIEGTAEESKKTSPHISSVGIEGMKYSVYQRLIARPLLRLLSFTRPSKKVSTPAEKQQKNKGITGFIVAILVFLLATPYIHFAITSYRIYVLLKQIKQEVTNLESRNLSSYATQLPVLVDGLTKDYKSVGYLKNIPKIGSLYIASSDLVYGGKDIVDSAAVVLDAIGPAMNIAKGLAAVSPNAAIETVPRDYSTEIGQIMSKENAVVQASQDAKIGNTRLQRVDIFKFPSSVQGNLYKVKNAATQYATAVDELSRGYDSIPYLLGYKEKRNYFVMLQNETEIRATGGWFTSYAIMNVENGQVGKLVVNDVYNFDGSISGVAAPTDMQRALGVKTMKLSLSNWNPAMDVTSKQVSQFLAQSPLAQQNDVTVAMTFQVIRDLLSVVGGVKVDGLGEVNAGNLYDKVGELHSQFVPGSQGKTSVLSQFVPKLLDMIASAPLAQKQEVLKVFGRSITQHSLMIYSENTELRTRLLDHFATYRTVKYQDKPLFIVDWNWGGNKANRFIKRSIDVILNEVDRKATITMLYTNDSKTDSYPEGKYVNEQRIYYPSEFTYLRSTGYTKNPVIYQTLNQGTYLLAEAQILKQETKPITVEFTMNTVPVSLPIYKQSGYDTEAVRVIITRSALNSKISEEKLQAQGFSKVDDKWVKTFVRKEDVTVELRD